MIRLLVAALWLASITWLFPKVVAVTLDKLRPDIALKWWSRDPEAAARVLDQQTKPSLDAIVEWSRMRPLDGRAYRQLAQAAEAAGDIARARVLYSTAALLSPRDRLARAWLADDAYARGDIDGVLTNATALISMDISLRKPVMQRLGELAASNPGIATRLARDLARAPEWRREFIASWAADAPAMDGLMQQALLQGSGFSEEERLAWVSRLREGRMMQAAQLAGRRAQPVTDGDFPPFDDPLFGWDLHPAPGTDMRRATDADGRTALRIGFSGQSTGVGTVEQSLGLPQGLYTVSYRVRLEDVRNSVGMRWTLECADGRVIGASAALKGDLTWRPDQFDAAVPEGCLRQRLLLKSSSDTAGTRRFDGTAWFTGVRVTYANGTGFESVKPATIPGIMQWAGCERVVETGLSFGNPCVDDAGRMVSRAPIRPESAGFVAIFKHWGGTSPNEAGTLEPDLQVAP